MKQHITVEQLKELMSDDLVCKLNTFMNHEWNITEEEYKTYTWNKILQDTAEYCTIGRMIALLESKDPCLSITKLINDGGCWGYEIKLRIIKYYKFSKGELADALWEAVKEVL